MAARAIKCAPPGLPDAPYQAAAIRTRPPRAIINPQPLLVKIRGARHPAKIKQSIRFSSAEIQRHGAAAFDGFGQHLANCPPKPCDLRYGQSSRRQSRRDAGAEQRFTRVNVADAGNERLIQQFDLYGLLRAFQRPPERRLVKTAVERFQPQLCHDGSVQRQPAKTSRK